jgi:NAD+ synthase (glutamine-hydrolysing)
MGTLRLVLAQLNVTVGDLEGNRRLIEDAIRRAQAWRADVVVVPEMSTTGYPPEDLLFKPRFVEENCEVIGRLAPRVHGLMAVIGCVERDRQGRLFNAAVVLAEGRHHATYHKQCLPNYGVFDERRYFTEGCSPLLIERCGIRIGLTICEDLWEPQPLHILERRGAHLVINLSASPYHAGKLALRRRLFAQRARAHGVAIAYCNLVGGQDELVFDGGSLVLDARGRVVAQAEQFREDLLVVDVTPAMVGRPGRRASRAVAERPLMVPHRRRRLGRLAEVYEALTLGARDYVRKNGFATVVLGLSGGIDSALTACLARDALGPEHVVGVIMPSRFSSAATQEDAGRLARALGIRALTIPIEPAFRAYLRGLEPCFGRRRWDVTEQNLQARIRGTLLMALSNKFGWLVLTTGNKSEIATGYTTLYGDMAGGFAVIKDVPKTLVYRLAAFRNARGPGSPIPRRVFERPPTAELAHRQTDQDTLPPYEVLDRILKAYVEDDQGLRRVIAQSRASPEIVRRVTAMVDRSEYKRRQGPPGIKITPKAFGRDRRMPITNRYQPS